LPGQNQGELLLGEFRCAACGFVAILRARGLPNAAQNLSEQESLKLLGGIFRFRGIVSAGLV
jgi:hypothetical protein